MTRSTPTDRAIFEDEGPGKLFAPKLGGVPWKGIASSQALAALVGAVFVRVLRDPSAVGVFFMAVVWAAATVLLAIVPYRRAASTRIVFDEGGVRLRTGAQCSYRPFASGSEGHYVGAFLAPAAIRLCDPEGRPFVEMPALGTMALYEAKDTIARFNRCSREAEPRVPPGLEPFVRGDKTLEAWRAELDGLARKARDRGYRGAGIDNQGLLSVLRDRRHRADLRAAAAYTLLTTEVPALRKAVRERLGAAAPPLVLLLASLAPGGAATVRPADLAGARPFLSDDDRRALS